MRRRVKVIPPLSALNSVNLYRGGGTDGSPPPFKLTEKFKKLFSEKKLQGQIKFTGAPKNIAVSIDNCGLDNLGN